MNTAKKLMMMMRRGSVGYDPTPGQTAYYRMDEASWDGTSGEIVDSGGGNYHGTRTVAAGATTTSESKFVNAGLFNTGGSYGKTGAFPYSAEFTLSAWVKRKGGVGTANKSIFGHTAAGTSAGDWYVYFTADNKVHIDVPYVAANAVVSAGTITDTATFHHIVATRTGTTGSWTYKIYIDGTLSNTGTTASNPNTSSHPLFMAALNDSASNVGLIILDDVRIYDRAFLAEEVAELYAYTPLA